MPGGWELIVFFGFPLVVLGGLITLVVFLKRRG
jgi:hypothetical protein